RTDLALRWTGPYGYGFVERTNYRALRGSGQAWRWRNGRGVSGARYRAGSVHGNQVSAGRAAEGQRRLGPFPARGKGGFVPEPPGDLHDLRGRRRPRPALPRNGTAG